MQAREEAEVRTHLLVKLDSHPDMTIEKTIEECQRFENVKHDSKLIEFRAKGEPNEVYGVLTRNNRREINKKSKAFFT